MIVNYLQIYQFTLNYQIKRRAEIKKKGKTKHNE